jgi:hypothetical protein
MGYEDHESIKRLWQKFVREQLADIKPEERQRFEQEFEKRFGVLLERAAGDGTDGFLDLIGFGDKGAPPFNELSYPYIVPDFDDAIIPSQLHAAAELYYIYQHEKMKVFQVVDILRRFFKLGRIRIQRGPGARGIYLLEKWKPLRYTLRDRALAYKRAFNYGTGPVPSGAIVNKNFHSQLVAFITSLAQYFRDLQISEVIKGGPMLDQRPFGSVATVQRLGIDLRYALDRSSYGNILALTHEVGHYLKTVMQLVDSPDIKKAFDANNKWDVVEIISNRHLGGAAELSQRAKMAESGRRILQWVSDNDFKTSIDPILFQSDARPFGPHAEAWIAAYRMTPKGIKFRGVTPTLRRKIGLRA